MTPREGYKARLFYHLRHAKGIGASNPQPSDIAFSSFRIVDFRRRFPRLAAFTVRVLTPAFRARVLIDMLRALFGRIGSETMRSVSFGRYSGRIGKRTL